MNGGGDSLTFAARWLRSKQSPNGSWSDFWTPSGVSDEWVTAYVGAAVSLADDAASRASAGLAWRYLAIRRHADGGWGYAAHVPSDADSTAWALILAQRIGTHGSASARGARDWLERACTSGGVKTYPDLAAIEEYLAIPSLEFSEWTLPRACVTGTAAQVRGLSTRLAADLCAAQRADGSWASYWWFEDAYATATSVAALADLASPHAMAAVERACGWAHRCLDKAIESSPFRLSLLLATLSANERSAAQAERCAAELIARQEQDGHWRGCARLRIPHPKAASHASGDGWRRWFGTGSPLDIYSIDQCSLFTTATAFAALHHASRTTRHASAVR